MLLGIFNTEPRHIFGEIMMKKLTLLALTLALVSGSSQAGTLGDFFSGITVGAGYSTDSVHGETLDGYSVYSQGVLVPSLKDNLFTDFRISSTSKDDYSSVVPKDGALNTTTVDLDRYQASIGYGIPYHVTNSVVLKPYVTAGWSWDKLSTAGNNETDNSFVASAGVKGEFGQHFMTSIGYSEETSGFKSGQWMLDVGYRF